MTHPRDAKITWIGEPPFPPGPCQPGPVTGVDFHLKEVEVYEDEIGLVVRQIWAGVDRPEACGVGLPFGAIKLAERLRKAMLAGAAYPAHGVRRDAFGKTYVETETNVLGRTLNADLKRLGF